MSPLRAKFSAPQSHDCLRPSTPGCRDAGSKNSRNPEAPEGTESRLQSYRAAELHSSGKHTHPWVVGGLAEEGGLSIIKGLRKFLLEKIHRALRIMSDRAIFGLDRRREAELSIVLISGKFVTCPPRLKNKFGLKSRMSFSSTLLVTRSFRLTSSGQ